MPGIITTPDFIDAKLELLGKRLKWARELVEPNRSKFAQSLGVDVSTIRNIENGSRSPSVALLLYLCHTLRISIEYLLNGELRGVDGELAALLSVRHPELMPRPTQFHGKPDRVAPGNTGHRAKTRGTDSVLVGQ